MSFISATQIRAERAAIQPEAADSAARVQGSPLLLTPACAGAGIVDQVVIADAQAPDEVKCDDRAAHRPQTPSPKEEGTLSANLPEASASTGEHCGPFTDTTATSHLGHHTIFTPQSQADFLESLASQGNVRLASRAARISAQTAYRARRQSPGFARAWDAARLSARTHAEDALAERALDGWEEPVFYHGEEIARRRRFSDRLLLAHLARLDALAERVDVEANLEVLDDQIEALRRGEQLVEVAEPQSPQSDPNSLDEDPVPTVPSCRVLCPDCGGKCDDPQAELGPQDCMWLGNRIERMHTARPRDAQKPHEIASGLDEGGEIEALQLEAFEADGHEWWLVTSESELIASCTHLYEEKGELAYPANS